MGSSQERKADRILMNLRVDKPIELTPLHLKEHSKIRDRRVRWSPVPFRTDTFPSVSLESTTFV